MGMGWLVSSYKWKEPVNLWLNLPAIQRQNPYCGPPSVYQDLSTCHDWPVKKAIV